MTSAGLRSPWSSEPRLLEAPARRQVALEVRWAGVVGECHYGVREEPLRASRGAEFAGEPCVLHAMPTMAAAPVYVLTATARFDYLPAGI